MYVSVGTLSREMATRVHRVIPVCHSEEFDECMEADNRFNPACRQYEPIYQAYEQDEDETDKIVDDIEYCDVTKAAALRQGLLFAATGAVVGLIIGIVFT